MSTPEKNISGTNTSASRNSGTSADGQGRSQTNLPSNAGALNDESEETEDTEDMEDEEEETEDVEDDEDGIEGAQDSGRAQEGGQRGAQASPSGRNEASRIGSRGGPDSIR